MQIYNQTEILVLMHGPLANRLLIHLSQVIGLINPVTGQAAL
ncbi:hypothetical protein [Oceanobacillus neutriphilus]|nr:hypothetical protein [Oceanobacillus neutriphilus]